MFMQKYLRLQPEELPSWLLKYKNGATVDFKTIMSSRVVYYPGAGYDGQPVATFNQGHFAHVYLYVDYGVSKLYIKEQFIQPGFLGYQCIAIQDFVKTDLVPKSSTFDLGLNREQIEKIKRSPIGEGFGFLGVFERLPEYNDKHGLQRFAVVYLGGDGIATFAALFASKLYSTPKVLILQDHGFGGNYDSFGGDGLMHAIAEKFDVYPEYILCADKTKLWKNYTLIKDVESVVGGMHYNTRKLYKRLNQNNRK